MIPIIYPEAVPEYTLIIPFLKTIFVFEKKKTCISEYISKQTNLDTF